MPKKQPSILIIIVTWNKKEYVIDLLRSLSSLEYDSAVMDILVIDNASNDGTDKAVTAEFPYVRLIRNKENIGGTGGFNTGLQWAYDQPEEHYKYYWLLDNDVLVHYRALVELVDVLEKTPDAAIAGSTMMQLDYPWRLNEMGAFFDSATAKLFFNRHMEEVMNWKGLSTDELLKNDADLTRHLMHCRDFMDVDYVAAASLLVRSEVARSAGLWLDFFIHFDDVEWCLRIGKTGHRVLVSAKSLIWHLSAAAKVPTWVLYYDNRNVLYLLKEHGAAPDDLTKTGRRVLKKGLYYTLIGKTEFGGLFFSAFDDFITNKTGKRDISLSFRYRSNKLIDEVFKDSSIRHILIPWTVNMQATGIQEPLVKAMKERDDLKIDFVITPEGFRICQLPWSKFISLSNYKIFRWIQYFFLRGKYDLVLQSDYFIHPGLSWLGSDILFINDDGYCRTKPPGLKSLYMAALSLMSRWFKL